MKTKALLASLVAVLVASQVMAVDNETDRQNRYSSNFYRWGEEKKDSGLFDSLQSKPLTETDLLMQLDKEGRLMYRSLSVQERRQVVELANIPQHRNVKSAVEAVHKQQWENRTKKQELMLHNGMDRVSNQAIQNRKRG